MPAERDKEPGNSGLIGTAQPSREVRPPSGREQLEAGIRKACDGSSGRCSIRWLTLPTITPECVLVRSDPAVGDMRL